MTRKIAHFSLRVAAATALLMAGFVPAALHAAEGGMVTGSVVDGGHHAVAGMTVRATDVVDPSKNYTAVTDSDGKFSIASLPAGSYLVSAETVNTSWIQKDDSPILEVSATSQPTVMLVLVKTSELAPAAVGGGNGHGLQVATLGVASLAAIGAAAALIRLDHVEDLNEDEAKQDQKLQDGLNRLQDDVNGLNNNINGLRGQVGSLDRDINNLNNQIDSLNKTILDLEKQIKNLQNLINKRIPASPSR